MSIPPPPDNSIAIGACAANQETAPPISAKDLIEAQSAGLATLMQSMGIQSCKTVTAAGAILFPPGAVGASTSIGCEQIAAIAGAIDSSQKVFQCAFTNQQASKSLTTNQILNVNIEIVDSILKCDLIVEQISNVAVMNYSEFDTQIQAQFTSTIQTTIQQLVDSIQKQTKEGLFTAADGQKTVQMMQQKLDLLVAQQSFVNIVKNVLEQYSHVGNVNIKISGSQLLGATNNEPNKPCFKATQNFLMQVISQTVLQDSLSLVFDSEMQLQMLQTLKNAQSTDVKGFTFPDFSGIVVVIILIVVAVALLMSKRSGGSDGSSSAIMSGKTGLIIAIIILLLGLAIMTTALILLFATKTNRIACYAILVGGAIMFFVGIAALVKAKAAK